MDVDMQVSPFLHRSVLTCEATVIADKLGVCR